MELIQDITGVILAGGKSSRFGSNKALARWRGKSLIQYASDALEAVFSDCILITNTPDEFEFLNMPMIMDRFKNMGPLAGIHAALEHTARSWVFVVGCDMPALTPELISFLCGYAHDDYEAVIPWLQAGPEPLCGLYHKTALDKIELQLKGNRPQVQELLDKLSVRKVKEEEVFTAVADLKVFLNVNREQDLKNIS